MILPQSQKEYFGRPLDFISPSDLRKKNTPKEYFHWKYVAENDPEADEKKVFVIGNAAHVAILQQHMWKQRVFVYNDIYPTRTKAYGPKKQHRARFEADILEKKETKEDPIIITPKEFELIQDMKRSLAKTMDISILNPKGAIIEQSFYAKLIFNKNGTVDRIEDLKDFEEVNNTPKDDLVLFICTKPDFVKVKDVACIDIDLKTCISVNPAKFQKDSYSMEYHLQASMGVDIVGACVGTEVDLFIFIAIEKTPPYDCVPFYAENDLIEYGRNVYQRRLWEIWKAHKAGYFEGYSIYSDMENVDEDGQDVRNQKMIPLTLPGYAKDPGYMAF